MRKPKFIPSTESKLSKTISKISSLEETEKTGFLTSQNDKTFFKTKSFRLRQADFINFSVIVQEINKNNDRKVYSDSEVIRGMINYVSNNYEPIIKKLISYIKDSS
jgi:effector-binding domain-containing protein